MEQEQQVERKETGMRILLTVLFVVIIRAVEVVLGIVVLFQLIFVLITKRRPGEQVARFANRIIPYVVQLLRYLTYQEDQRPFPFSDFPADSTPPETSARPNEHTPASLQKPQPLPDTD